MKKFFKRFIPIAGILILVSLSLRLFTAGVPTYPQLPNVGTAANLPASCGKTAQTYFATDTSVIYVSTVAGPVCTWQQFGVPASSAPLIPSGTDVGSVNAIVVNPTPAVSACANGTYGEGFNFTTTHTNTGATTINPSGTGVVSFKLIQNLAMSGGEIVSGSQLYGAFCDGNEWILVGSGSAGKQANPAGTINLAGAYIIPQPHSGIIAAGTTAGFTFASPPLSASGGGSRQMLNFLCIPLSGAGCGAPQNTLFSMGYDNDNIENFSGLEIAFQSTTENFGQVSLQSFSPGDNLTVAQLGTPSAGALALRVNAAATSTRVFGIDPNFGSAVLPRFTVATLPAASLFAGATAVVTDAATFTPGTCTGSGSDIMLAVSDGTNWTCH